MNSFHNNRFLMLVIHLKNILAETCVSPDEGALCTWLGEEKPNQRDFFFSYWFYGPSLSVPCFLGDAPEHSLAVCWVEA